MERTPLPHGFVVKMTNGGQYAIDHLIAEGGFSLVYDADTLGGTTSVVIKEYYPAKGASRNAHSRVCPLVGHEESFRRNLAQFEKEGVAGGMAADSSFQAVSFLACSEGYAVMKKESSDMCSIADLVSSWEDNPPAPFTGNSNDRDPVFPDIIRVQYALRVIESVLSALSAVHECSYLHLDISSRNVIWAGRDQKTGRNCSAFLADFGCAVPLKDGVFQPCFKLSYSPGFAAPEVQRAENRLTPATDIYSVGMLLFYLCLGDNALGITRNKRRQVQREIGYLKIPLNIKEQLADILCKATAEMTQRYQSTEEMQEAIRKLSEIIPQHPVNPDNTDSFSLYSLKSMLEGSLDTHYSWAHELRDRCNSSISLSDSICEPLSNKQFADDMDFLCSILPEEIFTYLKDRMLSDQDWQHALSCVMTGNYDYAWKEKICEKLTKYGTRRLLEISRTLLTDERAFFVDQKLLFQLIGPDGQRLKDCYYICDVRKNPCIGLAMFTLYALLGAKAFERLLSSPSEADKFFSPLK